MKKYTLILAALLLLSMPTKAHPVGKKTAQKAAETFMQAQTGAKVALRQIDYVDKAEFPHFYVFGTENSFVIISADDCVQPVLGYSTENPFGTEKMPENVFWWLKGYEEQIAYAEKSGQKATSDIAKEWKELISGNTSKAKSEVIVGPLIQTLWDQGSPYNNFCPGGNATGCVATAMAQIMKYWEYPTTGFGSHSYIPAAHPDYEEQTVNFGETTYDWANMLPSYSVGYSEAQAKAIATLMYHCGVSVNMNYGEDGTSSGAVTANVAYALQTFFNYSQTAQYISRSSIVNEAGQEDLEQWKNMLKAELDAYPPRPLQYRGKGHSFICDGYNSDDKFHFNWGWGNSADGYYLVNNLTVNSNFNKDQAAIFGIQPITYQAQPSQLTASATNQNVSLTWNEVQGVSSYNVYRDYRLIGNTSSNIFLDSGVPIGNHVYYFRCVDSEGNVSLPSNAQSVDVNFGYTLESLMTNNLEISYNNGDATLQWETPINLNHIDYYSFEGDSGALNIGNHNIFYWGARFPSSMLTSGTSITSVSTVFYTSGTYNTYVYKCASAYPTGDPITVNGTYTNGWHNIPLESPITIDNESDDIWVIFKSYGINLPTIVGVQNAGVQNINEGNYYSFDETTWYHFNGYSFFISASLTDGNFTYNVYDNGVCVAEDLNVPIYTLSNISSNTAHQYSVKTKLGNEETAASNMVGVTVGNANLESLELGDNDNMTITENSTLTVENLTNTNPDNLIIENGGQLITSSEDVQATVKKNIEAAPAWGEGEYTADGWYFIASPIVSNSPDYIITGMITNDETVDETDIHTFDLYRYNGNAALEWENYWTHHTEETPFTIDNGAGYLYASKNGTTIGFKGVINPYKTESNTVTLAYDGWNLIGNPFTCAVTVDRDFAELNNGSAVVYQTSGSTINPCAGIAVYGNANETVTFSMVEPQSPAQSPNSLNLILTQQVLNRDGTSESLATIDNAIVSFDKGNRLSKFHIGEKKADLYIPMDEKEYAIVSVDRDVAQTMDINFKAYENGTYTLNIEAENTDLDYLHLIDNLTGEETDLLETPSYTFEAKTSDYASRFRLVFINENDHVATDDDETFAFVNNGQLQILNQGKAQLQIVDITGRILYSETIAGDHILPFDLNAGVYIMRLSTDQTTRTQKIVVQ